MKKFWIYYRKNPTFRTYGKFADEKEQWQAVYDMMNDNVEVNTKIYQFVTFQWAESVDEIFHTMQGEIWSPNGEARSLIRALGLHHTSMSVGDLVVDQDKNVYECDSVGWKQILEFGFTPTTKQETEPF